MGMNHLYPYSIHNYQRTGPQGNYETKHHIFYLLKKRLPISCENRDMEISSGFACLGIYNYMYMYNCTCIRIIKVDIKPIT